MTWQQLVTLIGAGAAVIAAFVAGRFAVTTQAAAHAGQRALELEKRLASIKEEIYRP